MYIDLCNEQLLFILFNLSFYLAIHYHFITESSRESLLS
jgi:hypothetical protein